MRVPKPGKIVSIELDMFRSDRERIVLRMSRID